MRDYSKTDYTKQKKRMNSLMQSAQAATQYDKSHLEYIVYMKNGNEFLKCRSRAMAISTAKRIEGTYSKII